MFSIKTVSRYIFLALLFVFVLFTPPIRFLPFYTWLLALLGIFTLRDRKFIKMIGLWSKTNVEFLKYLAFVIVINCIIIPIIHGAVDLSYIPLQIGIILCLLRSVLLIYCLHRYTKGSIMSQYCKYFFIACCIYVSFTLVFIFEPGFKSFWLDTVLTDVKDMSLDFAVYEFRYSLDGFAAFSSASVFSFACLFCSYLIASSRNVSIIMIACLMLMVIGCFFYGRVSLIGMLLGGLLIVWTSGSIFKTVRIIAIIVAFVFGLLAVLNIVSQSNESLVAWQDWAFSIVKQLFVEKEVTDYSVTHMVEDMYYIPDAITILFGDGKYSNADGTYYGHTDVGFMRLVLYGGIFCLIFVYTIIFKLSRNIVRVSNSVIFKRFILLSVILFLVLEMKGESYQRAIMMLYPLFFLQNYINYNSAMQQSIGRIKNN